MKEVRYLGTMVTSEGIKLDLMKVSAIVEMTSPTDRAGIRRLLSMINFLAAHIPNVSTITAPLQSLLKSDTLFTLGSRASKCTRKNQINSFHCPCIKLFSPSCYKHYTSAARHRRHMTCCDIKIYIVI